MFEKYTDQKTYSRIVDYDSISAMWNNCINDYANNIAINDNGKDYTFSSVEKDASFFRTTLIHNDLKYSDRVGALIPNSYEFVKAFISITTLGMIAVLLPTHLDEKSLYGISLKYNLKALVYDPSLEEKLSLVKNNPNCKLININDNSLERTELVDVNKEDACAILFTGGTTGKSKGALLSNGAILQGTKNGCYGYKDVFNERYFLVLPLTHVFGLVRNLLTSLYTGSNIHICRNNKDMFKEMAIFKPTILVLVPALAEMALSLSKEFKRNMLGDSVKYIICGAANVPPYLIKEYKNLGITMFPGYGLTESANLVSGNPESETKPDSVGIPYERQTLKFVNGELWLKGANMMMGYADDEEENKNAYEDGYFKTGDLAHLDDEGFLYITGRIKECIVLSSGKKVSPAEIENKINTIDVIQDSLVYEEEDNNKQVLVLEILPRKTVLDTIDVEDKDQYIKDRINEINNSLPSFMRISKIVIRDKDFPRSPSMKILRKKKKDE